MALASPGQQGPPGILQLDDQPLYDPRVTRIAQPEPRSAGFAASPREPIAWPAGPQSANRRSLPPSTSFRPDRCSEGWRSFLRSGLPNGGDFAPAPGCLVPERMGSGEVGRRGWRLTRCSGRRAHNDRTERRLQPTPSRSVPAIPTSGLSQSGGIIPAIRIFGTYLSLVVAGGGYRQGTYQTLGWLER
jgi:hypothetical protein